MANSQSGKQNEPMLDEAELGSPQYEHKKKLLKEDAKRKKDSVIVDRWIENPHDSHPKGGKVTLKTQMKNGNVHSHYLGRYRTVGKDAIDAYRKKGVSVRQPKLD
jgi:hypothetical protein